MAANPVPNPKPVQIPNSISWNASFYDWLDLLLRSRPNHLHRDFLKLGASAEVFDFERKACLVIGGLHLGGFDHHFSGRGRAGQPDGRQWTGGAVGQYV